MQDDAGAKGLNPLLERHWEKIVLGVVAVGFLIFLGAKFSGGGNSAAKGLNEVVASISQKKNALNPTLEGPKSMPETPKDPPPTAFIPPPGTVGKKPTYKADPKRPPVVAKAPFFFPKVTLSTPQANFDGVDLEWSLSGAVNPEDKPKPIEVKPATFFFQIERRKRGDKDWEILAKEVKGDRKAYRDEKTTPKTEYEYKVTLGSTDPVFGAGNPTRLTDKVGGPAITLTPGIWKVEYNNAMAGTPDDDVPKPPTVYVKITKFDPDAGEVSWSKIHKEGQALGVDDSGNSVHSVHSVKKGRTVSVDFKMGGKIAKIATDKLVPHNIQVCSPKINKDGQLECDGPKKESAPYRVNEITFTDEEGKTQIEPRVSGPAPQSDRLCPDHGGAPIVRGPSPEEKAIKAAKLLQDADTLWNTNKRQEAQEIYKQLLATYGDTDAVKPRKNDIAERSTQKLN